MCNALWSLSVASTCIAVIGCVVTIWPAMQQCHFKHDQHLFLPSFLLGSDLLGCAVCTAVAAHLPAAWLSGAAPDTPWAVLGGEAADDQQ